MHHKLILLLTLFLSMAIFVKLQAVNQQLSSQQKLFLESQQKHQQQIKTLLQIFERYPLNFQQLNSEQLSCLGYGYLALQYYDTVLKIAEIGLTQTSQHHRDFYYQRGLTRAKLGEKATALQDLNQAGVLGIPQAYEQINEICKELK